MHRIKDTVGSSVQASDKESLRAIREAFSRAYPSYNLRLPRENVLERKNGSLRCGSGMLFYAFGTEADREYLEYYCYHHMGEGHARIYDDGTVVELPTLDDLDIASGLPHVTAEEKVEMEDEYRKTRESIRTHGLYDDEWHY
jgi:hypothetical protein